MKKWISLLFVAALMLSVNVGWTNAAAKQVAAAPIPKLYLDGKALSATAPPALVNKSVLVPIRTVAENLGYQVGFDTKKKQVSLKEGSKTILMTVNNPKATVNGKEVTMNEPPVLQSATTLIPLRFVGETFGLQILWDNGSKSAFLFSDATTGNGSTDPNGGTGNGNTGTGTGNTGAVGPGTGTGTGNGNTGTGTGTPPPADGGLIGVVDGSDGTGAVDGGSTGTTDGGGDVLPTPPAAHLHQVRYEPNAVVITYDGMATPAPRVLTGPDRIVIDLPGADYADDFSAGYSSGITPDFTPVVTGIPADGAIPEMAVSDHEALLKIRYSQFQNTPKIARLVLDLNQPYGYELLNDTVSGELRIMLKKPQSPPSPPSKTAYTVVLDPGHGGSDPGAPSVSGRWEKDFNLTMIKKIQAILAQDTRINLILTRTSDTYPTLDDRVNLANNQKADLFLSVHANSYMKATNGTETYYTRGNSLDFANLLHKNAVAATGLKDNGVRNANFKVIKYTTMPAVLLEVGYLSNAGDEKKLFNDDFQNRVAEAIAVSIKQYLKLS